MLKANKVGALDDLVIRRASNSNITRINKFDHMTQRGHLKTPANKSLAHNQSRATGGSNTLTSDYMMTSGGSHLASQSLIQAKNARTNATSPDHNSN